MSEEWTSWGTAWSLPSRVGASLAGVSALPPPGALFIFTVCPRPGFRPAHRRECFRAGLVMAVGSFVVSHCKGGGRGFIFLTCLA